MQNKIFTKFVQDHVAVSSLESPLHATRKDPRIISITWFIGKRCNYDCSYCPSYTHDNFSPHIKKVEAINFINALEKYALEQNKTFKISITGGEPFVHPDFMSILQHLKQKKSLTQLVVVTNGSVSLEKYVQSLNHITNLTISLHLEQNNKIVDRTIEKIVALTKLKKAWINVNLMVLPKSLTKIKKIIKIFQQNKVKFVLIKIDPPVENVLNKIKKGDTQKILKAEEKYLQNKLDIKTKYHTNLEQRHEKYYTKKELQFIENFEQQNQWKNIKLHQEDKIMEMNTSDLVAKKLNKWKGWQCYIGIDSLYVQHDGTIFRGNCMQGNIIGKIGSNINWPKTPIKCPTEVCVCNADMPIRKVKESKYEYLIHNKKENNV